MNKFREDTEKLLKTVKFEEILPNDDWQDISDTIIEDIICHIELTGEDAPSIYPYDVKFIETESNNISVSTMVIINVKTLTMLKLSVSVDSEQNININTKSCIFVWEDKGTDIERK